MQRPLIIGIYLLILITGFNEVALGYRTSPQASFNVEQSDQYGCVINPRYANNLGVNSALGFEISFGSTEFRLGGTFVKLLQDHHLFKLTGDYLSQQNQFAFLTGITSHWTIQHSFAGGYSYLIHDFMLRRINFNAYQLHSRDESLAPIFEADDNVAALYRTIKGADAYGTAAGITLQPFKLTRLTLDANFDAVNYRTQFEKPPNSTGLGASLQVSQVLHPRLVVGIDYTHRSLYERYQAKVNWLIPGSCCNGVELSLFGQCVRGELPYPKENRIGLMLTYHWNLTPFACYMDYLDNDIVQQAATPLVRMPQTLVVVDQQIVSR